MNFNILLKLLWTIMWWFKWWLKTAIQNSESQDSLPQYTLPLLKEKYIWKSSSSFYFKGYLFYFLNFSKEGITGDNGFTVFYILDALEVVKIGKVIQMMWCDPEPSKMRGRAHRLRCKPRHSPLGNLEPCVSFSDLTTETSTYPGLPLDNNCVQQPLGPNQFIIYSARDFWFLASHLVLWGLAKAKGLLIAVLNSSASAILSSVSLNLPVQLGTFIRVSARQNSKAFTASLSVSAKENGGLVRVAVLCILWCYFIIELQSSAYYKGKGKRIRKLCFGETFSWI